MKGFVKVLEVIVAVSIMFTFVYSYFVIDIYTDESWPSAMNKVEASDLLNSLYKNGTLEEAVMSNNYERLEDMTRNVLPLDMDYRYYIKGIPKRTINITVIGSSQQAKKLENMVSPLEFNFKNRSITINIKNATYFDNSSDISLFFGYENYTLSKEKSFSYLSNDKAIFLFSDYSTGNALDEIFGLEPKSGDATTNNVFYNISNVSLLSYKTNDYFKSSYIRVNTSSGLSEFYIRKNSYQLDTDIDQQGKDVVVFNGNNYTENQSFTVNSENVKVYGVDGNQSTTTNGYKEYADIGITSDNYNFGDLIDDANTNKINADEKTIVKSTNNFSAVKANYQITDYGRGRTIWMAGYEKKYSDYNQLIKALVLWAAGQEEDFGGITTDKGAGSTLFVYSNSSIYSVELSIWPVLQ